MFDLPSDHNFGWWTLSVANRWKHGHWLPKIFRYETESNQLLWVSRDPSIYSAQPESISGDGSILAFSSLSQYGDPGIWIISAQNQRPIPVVLSQPFGERWVSTGAQALSKNGKRLLFHAIQVKDGVWTRGIWASDLVCERRGVSMSQAAD